jgi:hypothetical protein
LLDFSPPPPRKLQGIGEYLTDGGGNLDEY